MKYISEDRLIEEIEFYDIDVRARDIINSLIDQCQELNPWKPIESAPKDRIILLYYPTIKRPITGAWLENINAFHTGFDWLEGQPTHWIELPEPPK